MQAHRRHDISDRIWENIQAHLPGSKGLVGRPANDNRLFINAVFWILGTGAPYAAGAVGGNQAISRTKGAQHKDTFGRGSAWYAAIWVTGETCSVVFDGALDGKIYNAYIEQFLLPTLKAGDMVIMDNLNVHKSKTAQKLITEKGCEYIFLPEYSPDLNPIEKMWSKVKQLLRSMKARTCDEL